MSPELYEAIKDILNYNRVDSVQREAGMTGFIGDSHAARQRLERLEWEFAHHAPHKKTLVDTWVALRNKAFLPESKRISFLPATTIVPVTWERPSAVPSGIPDDVIFETHVHDVTLPSLVDDIASKKLFFSKLYGVPLARFCCLDEKARAEEYLTDALSDDVFPALNQFWEDIKVNLAVDHLYIFVDHSGTYDFLLWQVVAVTRNLTAASAPYEHNATLVNTEGVTA